MTDPQVNSWQEWIAVHQPPKWLWLGLLGMAFFRYFLAAYIPLGNDEAYYWDWGRDLQLSYIDHPPGVAWISSAASQIFSGAFAARGLSPVIHLFASLSLWYATCELLGRVLTKDEARGYFLLTQLVPVFNLGGILLMPDVGLLLALSGALWAALVSLRADRLTWCLGGLFGLGIGLACCFKYHAAPIGGGLILGLAYARLRTLKSDAPFWAAFSLTFAMCLAPVIVWNLTHEFASFVFQGSHGFTRLSLRPTAFLQAIAGLLVFLTPLIAWRLSQLLRREDLWRLPGCRLIFIATLPLVALLFGLAMVKQVLPHWFVPSLWLLIPVLIAFGKPVTTGLAAKLNIGLALLVGIALPTLFASASVRQSVVEATGGRPGGLGELTLWQPATQVLGEIRAELADQALTVSPEHCKALPLASLRWYWTAQLAFALQEKVYSFDFNHISYYNFRDDFEREGLIGCPFLLFGSRDHFDERRLTQYGNLISVREVKIPYHDDQPAVVGIVILTVAPDMPARTYY